MSLIALANCLLGEPMPRRFHAEPMVRATELLLQERVPRVRAGHGNAGFRGCAAAGRPGRTGGRQPPADDAVHGGAAHPSAVERPLLGDGDQRRRRVQPLRRSGRHAAREDFTRDDAGQFCYIRDLTSGLLWSTGHQPIGRPTDQYEVLYSADKAEFRRVDGHIATSLEIAVSPQDSAEVRRVTLTNHNSTAHELELTSYAEVVLAPHGADLAHPAFGKLFLETEWAPTHAALICRRRPRAPEQPPVWGVHVAAVGGAVLGDVQYETDRGRFLGRGRTTAAPAALDSRAALSGTTGAVLDPIFSLRLRVAVPPGSSVSVAFTTVVALSREEALLMADHYRDYQAVVRLRSGLGALPGRAASPAAFHRGGPSVPASGVAPRSTQAPPCAPPAVLAANNLSQPALWRHGISGDRPILLLSIADSEHVAARRLLAAHHYWRLKSLEVDLVILNEHPTSYLDSLRGAVRSRARQRQPRPPGQTGRRLPAQGGPA